MKSEKIIKLIFFVGLMGCAVQGYADDYDDGEPQCEYTCARIESWFEGTYAVREKRTIVISGPCGTSARQVCAEEGLLPDSEVKVGFKLDCQGPQSVVTWYESTHPLDRRIKVALGCPMKSGTEGSEVVVVATKDCQILGVPNNRSVASLQIKGDRDAQLAKCVEANPPRLDYRALADNTRGRSKAGSLNRHEKGIR